MISNSGNKIQGFIENQKLKLMISNNRRKLGMCFSKSKGLNRRIVAMEGWKGF